MFYSIIFLFTTSDIGRKKSVLRNDITGLLHCSCGFEAKLSRVFKGHNETNHPDPGQINEPTLGVQSIIYPTSIHTPQAPSTLLTPDPLSTSLNDIAGTATATESKASKTKQCLEFLNSIGLQMHPKLKLLICLDCQYAYLPSRIFGHVKKHSIERKDLSTVLAETVNFLQIPSNPIVIPKPNGLPIEGIKVQDGLACTLCDYVCCTDSSKDKHNQTIHNSVKVTFTPCKAQTIYFPIEKKYFSVILPEKLPSSITCYDLFAEKILPTIPQLSIGAASSEREISALLSMTQWHIHLKDWHKEPKKRKEIKSLVKVASSQEPWAKTLLKGVEKYMLNIRDIANGVEYIVLKKLMQSAK